MKFELKTQKLIPILIVCILLFSGLTPLASAQDELDQYQTIQDTSIIMGSGEGLNISIAQSFRPQKEILTRIELLIGRDIDHPAVNPYVCVIRKSLSGENLAIASINPDDIPIGTFEWKEFDFEDIQVTTGDIYYIVSYTPYIESTCLYLWGCSLSNSYQYGQVYASDDGWNTWESTSDVDTCFKTYGTYAPLVADADGPYEGVVNDPIQFHGGATGGKPPLTWHWDFGDGNYSTDQNPIHTYDAMGEYHATLTVTDSDHNVCNDTTTVTISKPYDLEITSISGGKGLTVVITNVGESNITDIEVDITVAGGLFVYLPTPTYNIPYLDANESQELTIPVFGFGLGILTALPAISITVAAPGVSTVQESQHAKIMFSRVIIG